MEASTAIGGRRAAREAAKRKRTRRGVAIAVASTVIVFAVLVALIVTSPGWEEVKEKFFNWEVFKDSFPGVAEGFWLDVRIFMVVEVVVLVLGLVIAIVRTTTSAALAPLRILATVYTDFFRGVPVILLVYVVGFGIPALDLEGLPTNKVLLGGIALTLCYSAYVSEVYRAGIASIHRSQRDAALAVGLTEFQARRHVIVPQAIRRVGPPLLNDFISLQKDVALVSILGPQEAFRIAQVEAASDFNYTPFMAAALLYLCVTVPLARLVDRYGGTGGVTR